MGGAGEHGERDGTCIGPREAAIWMLRGRTARTAGPVALVVGTALSAVNQGPVIASGPVGWGARLRIAVNYLSARRLLESEPAVYARDTPGGGLDRDAG